MCGCQSRIGIPKLVVRHLGVRVHCDGFDKFETEVRLHEVTIAWMKVRDWCTSSADTILRRMVFWHVLSMRVRMGLLSEVRKTQCTVVSFLRFVQLILVLVASHRR